jgi:16S rRNA (guanine966-N2)-methyltransferase
VRIIAGQWRGRRLPIAPVPGLRPSGDRSRETLFNWLQPQLAGARCVDLFAGSGALGLEAASRGAAAVTLVEHNAVAADQLRENVELLKAASVRVVEDDALGWLRRQPPRSIDIVFVDPPFGSALQAATLALLAEGEHVREGGLVYVEAPRNGPVAAPAAAWLLKREKVIGEVLMQLFEIFRGELKENDA